MAHHVTRVRNMSAGQALPSVAFRLASNHPQTPRPHHARVCTTTQSEGGLSRLGLLLLKVLETHRASCASLRRPFDVAIAGLPTASRVQKGALIPTKPHRLVHKLRQDDVRPCSDRAPTAGSPPTPRVSATWRCPHYHQSRRSGRRERKARDEALWCVTTNIQIRLA